LKIAKQSKSEIADRVREAAKILDLEEYLERKPGQLSGGQRQRVAMGRAIVRQPHVFLMDEPLSNLDAKLRVSTRSQISELQRRLGVTTLYVTHDQVEAMTMGDRVAVMKDGLLLQVDAPRRLYDSPDNAFVAGFIGSPAMNLLAGTLTDDGVQVGSAVLAISRTLHQAAGTGSVTVGLRPESLEIASDDNGINAVVTLVEQLGAEAFVYAQMAEHSYKGLTAAPDLIVRVDPSIAVGIRDKITLRVKRDSALLFDAESGARISA
jgi:multiple sugar transport system ATP-binding protein